MRAFYIIIGLAGITFISFAIPDLLERYRVEKNGALVNVVLTQVPPAKGFIKFEYQGKQFSTKVDNTFHDHYKVGDSLGMRHLPGSEYFLLEKERIAGHFFALGVFVLVCLMLIGKGILAKDL
jgi:hypothetical protein